MSSGLGIQIVTSIDLTKTRGVKERAGDLRPAWATKVQPLVTDYLTRRFAMEGAYLGPRWAPLKPSTLRRRRRAGHGRGGIGRDTGRLWASLVKSAGTIAAPGGLLLIAPTRYERGTAVPYARWFHGGTRRQPARELWTSPLPPSLASAVAIALRNYIARGEL